MGITFDLVRAEASAFDASGQLGRAVSAIAAHEGVVAVILFGSTARDEASVGSDRDLLVLVDDSVAGASAFAAQLRLELYPIVDRPLDLIVERSEDFFDRSSRPTLEGAIVREGRLLHVA
ncbi:MAG TPA: nucleotidyltransferase domain-containing protein [Spirochaetales bacterium]|nr:nucleotidyltransferase domain-containing protein [Spirochaetales bacterium]